MIELEELRRQENVERARHRIERERGRLGPAVRLGEELDVVRGRAGALGDARDRGAVDLEAVGQRRVDDPLEEDAATLDRKSTRLNSSHGYISYAVFCLKKKKN